MQAAAVLSVAEIALPPAVAAERFEMRGRSGRLSYYVAGSGRPMLLLHSINAAASVREVQPVFDHAVQSCRVYAPDLPGSMRWGCRCRPSSLHASPPGSLIDFAR
jgi:hypothetical protein